MKGSHEELQLLVLKWFNYFGNHQQYLLLLCLHILNLFFLVTLGTNILHHPAVEEKVVSHLVT